MALPSQNAQPLVRRRSQTYRRSRRRRRPAVIAALALLVLAFVAIRLALPGDPSQGPSAEPQANAAAGPDRGVGTRADSIGELRPAAATARFEPVEAAGMAADTGRRTLEPAPRTPPIAGQPPLAAAIEHGDFVGPPSPRQVAEGLALANTNRPVQARQALSAAITGRPLEPAEADLVREALTVLNQRLVFSPEIVAGDPFAHRHVVGAGEHLAGIVKARSLQVDWRFILRINRIADDRSLRAGQRLKLITGPFHAVVHKSDYRLDLFMGAGPQRVFVCSFDVGLGEYNSTPAGLFRVRPQSKLVNPAWANPRTGQRYERNDPGNPIGERWIGLQGLDDTNRDLAGYGIHGTIDPESIGMQSSMGCIRMRPADVELLYEVLTERASTVEVRP